MVGRVVEAARRLAADRSAQGGRPSSIQRWMSETLAAGTHSASSKTQPGGMLPCSMRRTIPRCARGSRRPLEPASALGAARPDEQDARHERRAAHRGALVRCPPPCLRSWPRLALARHAGSVLQRGRADNASALARARADAGERQHPGQRGEPVPSRPECSRRKAAERSHLPPGASARSSPIRAETICGRMRNTTPQSRTNRGRFSATAARRHVAGVRRRPLRAGPQPAKP